MSDEIGSGPKGEANPEHVASVEVQPDGTASAAQVRWSRADRNRMLLWVAMAFIAPGVIIGVLSAALHWKISFSVRGQLPVKAFLALAVFFATWVIARAEKRPLDDYGMPLRQMFGARFREGLAWGFAALSAVLFVIHTAGGFQIEGVALAGMPLLKHIVGWGAVFFAVAIHEEFSFRGYLLFAFARRMKFWPAAIVVSAIFGVAHLANPGENILGILQVVVIGLIFCLMIRRTGTLWFAVGFHAAWDWAETFFYGTPDSGLVGTGHFLNTSAHGAKWLTGGAAGPEGSVVAFAALLGCALLVHLRFPKANYPDRPV